MRCRDFAVAAGLTLFAACNGDGKTATAPAAKGQLQLSIVGGAAQTDSVFAMLPTPIAVHAARVANGISTPAANQVVNFAVVEPGCGRTYADSETTDLQGNTTVRWELGAAVGTCHLEARATDRATGQPVVFGNTSATATPGVVDTLLVADNADGFRYFTGSIASVRSLVSRTADRHGNVVEHPLLTVLTRWESRDDTIVFPKAEAVDTVIIIAPQRNVSRVFMAVRDLRASKWSLDFTCGPLAGQTDSAGVPIDSFRVTGGAIDSVHYPASNYPTSSYLSAPGNLLYSGLATAWHHDGTTAPFRLARQSQTLVGQTPRTIDFGGAVAQQTGDVPVVYSGDAIAWCSQFGAQRNPAHVFTMTAH